MPGYEFSTQDVEYLRHGDRRFVARLFKPHGSGPFPAIVEVPGGAWCNGDLNECQIYAEGFARVGLALAAMRPNDPRYAAIQLPSAAPAVDATVKAVAMLWPVINPLSRYRHALRARDSANPPA